MKTTLKSLLAAIAIACAAIPAQAQEQVNPPMTTVDLLSLMHDNEISARAYAAGIITGAFDSLPPNWWCPPKRITRGDVYDFVQFTLERDSSFRSRKATDSVRLIVINLWPCKK